MNKIAKELLQTVEIGIKTAVSAIPIGGTLINEVFDTVKNNCLDKRQQKWKQKLENRISKIEATLGTLGNSEIFTSAIIKTTEIAMKTSSERKIQYLANAVVNAYKNDVEETRFYLYMDLVERYTDAHIEMMKRYVEPSMAEPDRENEIDCIILNALVTDGLLLYSNDAKGEYILSSFGKDFLLFLTNTSGEQNNARNER